MDFNRLISYTSLDYIIAHCLLLLLLFPIMAPVDFGHSSFFVSSQPHFCLSQLSLALLFSTFPEVPALLSDFSPKYFYVFSLV